jgi:riboflavin-specific deaminase-like protein
VSATLRRLLPEPGETTIAELLDGYRPWEQPEEERPRVAVNFVTTVDGRAALDGRTKDLGSEADTEMLQLLRTRFDAVMVGAGTMRAERYGRIVSDPQLRARRERAGLPHDPLAVIVSGRLDLPWDAPIFTDGGGRILLFTASDAEPPETATPLRVVRHEDFVDPVEMMRHLRHERGIRALLCEGGPGLHGELQAAGLVDELFLTIAPLLTGGEAPRILEAELVEPAGLELAWLLEAGGELFCRYRRRPQALR